MLFGIGIIWNTKTTVDQEPQRHWLRHQQYDRLEIGGQNRQIGRQKYRPILPFVACQAYPNQEDGHPAKSSERIGREIGPNSLMA